MKSKLPIIIVAVVLVAVVGAYMSGAIGGKAEGPTKKHVIEPVTLAAPFTVNTKDAGGSHYAVFSVALQLDPLSEPEWLNWSGANAGGHGGGGEAPGPAKLANYPKFRSAIVETASGFTMEQLSSTDGREIFKNELLEKFAAIAEVDEAEHKSSPEDPTEIGIAPPYHVKDIYFTDFAVQ